MRGSTVCKLEIVIGERVTEMDDDHRGRAAQEIVKVMEVEKESTVQQRLAGKPDSVRSICLSEFKGPLDQFRQGWVFYCVPPGDLNSKLCQKENPALYLEWQSFHVPNLTGESEEIVRTKWMKDESATQKLSVFAIRR